MEIWNDSANFIALQWLNAGFYEGDIFGSLGEWKVIKFMFQSPAPREPCFFTVPRVGGWNRLLSTMKGWVSWVCNSSPWQQMDVRWLKLVCQIWPIPLGKTGATLGIWRKQHGEKSQGSLHFRMPFDFFFECMTISLSFQVLTCTLCVPHPQQRPISGTIHTIRTWILHNVNSIGIYIYRV